MVLRRGVQKTLFSIKKLENKTPNPKSKLTISKRVQVGASTEEEVRDQIEWEAEQYIPFDIDDATISHHVVGENPGGGMDVVLCAISNAVGESFQILFEEMYGRLIQRGLPIY